MPLVARVRGQRLVGVVFDEPLARVDQDGVFGAQVDGLLPHGVERRLRALARDHIAFAEVQRHRDDVVTRFDILFEQNRRIEAAGICENDLHDVFLYELVRMSSKRCMTIGSFSGSSTITSTVSSPPRVPSTSGQSAASIAEATIIALPGGVRSTI